MAEDHMSVSANLKRWRQLEQQQGSPATSPAKPAAAASPAAEAGQAVRAPRSWPPPAGEAVAGGHTYRRSSMDEAAVSGTRHRDPSPDSELPISFAASSPKTAKHAAGFPFSEFSGAATESTPSPDGTGGASAAAEDGAEAAATQAAVADEPPSEPQQASPSATAMPARRRTTLRFADEVDDAKDAAGHANGGEAHSNGEQLSTVSLAAKNACHSTEASRTNGISSAADDDADAGSGVSEGGFPAHAPRSPAGTRDSSSSAAGEDSTAALGAKEPLSSAAAKGTDGAAHSNGIACGTEQREGTAVTVSMAGSAPVGEQHGAPDSEDSLTPKAPCSSDERSVDSAGAEVSDDKSSEVQTFATVPAVLDIGPSPATTQHPPSTADTIVTSSDAGDAFRDQQAAPTVEVDVGPGSAEGASTTEAASAAAGWSASDPASADGEFGSSAEPSAPSTSTDMVAAPAVDGDGAGDDGFGTFEEAAEATSASQEAPTAEAPAGDGDDGSGTHDEAPETSHAPLEASFAEGPLGSSKDGFGTFVEAAGSSPAAQEAPALEAPGDSDDGFGTFEEATGSSPAAEEAPDNEVPAGDSDDGFGTFEEAGDGEAGSSGFAGASADVEGGSDDGFGSFEEAAGSEGFAAFPEPEPQPALTATAGTSAGAQGQDVGLVGLRGPALVERVRALLAAGLQLPPAPTPPCISAVKLVSLQELQASVAHSFPEGSALQHGGLPQAAGAQQQAAGAAAIQPLLWKGSQAEARLLQRLGLAEAARKAGELEREYVVRRCARPSVSASAPGVAVQPPAALAPPPSVATAVQSSSLARPSEDAPALQKAAAAGRPVVPRLAQPPPSPTRAQLAPMDTVQMQPSSASLQQLRTAPDGSVLGHADTSPEPQDPFATAMPMVPLSGEDTSFDAFAAATTPGTDLASSGLRSESSTAQLEAILTTLPDLSFMLSDTLQVPAGYYIG